MIFSSCVEPNNLVESSVFFFDNSTELKFIFFLHKPWVSLCWTEFVFKNKNFSFVCRIRFILCVLCDFIYVFHVDAILLFASYVKTLHLIALLTSFYDHRAKETYIRHLCVSDWSCKFEPVKRKKGDFKLKANVDCEYLRKKGEEELEREQKEEEEERNRKYTVSSYANVKIRLYKMYNTQIIRCSGITNSYHRYIEFHSIFNKFLSLIAIDTIQHWIMEQRRNGRFYTKRYYFASVFLLSLIFVFISSLIISSIFLQIHSFHVLCVWFI